MDRKTIRRIGCTALLAAIFYFCFFSGLDAIGLVGPDEPRYAAIAREMASSGDWVTPRLFGQPWFEKPVLYYWSAALAFRSGLTNETAARLPSGIFALLATLGLAWAARRTYGTRTALTFLLMLPTCAGMIGFAHAAATDMPFAACLTLAMVAGAQLVWAGGVAGQAESKNAPAWGWACAWGFFLGLAALAKGPAALALAAGSVALWVIATRRWRNALRLFHPAGIAAFLLTALPWYVVCATRNPTFVRVFLLEHNLERFTTNRYQHAQPFWFFAPILLLAIFPWTFLLGACVKDALRIYREKRLADSPSMFFVAWAIFPFLFFSVSQSKLPGYILPCVPPLALLIARSLARLMENDDLAIRGWLLSTALAFFLLALGSYRWLSQVNPFPAPAPPQWDTWMSLVLGIAPTILLSLLLLVSVELGFLAIRRKGLPVVWVSAVSVALLVGGIGKMLLPVLDPQISLRAAAYSALNLSKDTSRIRVYEISRAWQYGVNYYLAREIPEWAPQQRRVWVITNDAGASELRRLGVHAVEEQRISRQATVLHIE